MSLLATRLCALDFIVFPLEATVLTLGRYGLFDKVLRPILLVDARRIELCGTFNYGPRLRELGNFRLLGVCLLVVSMRVKDRAHLNELEVALEGRRDSGERHVEPVFTSVGRSIL